MNEQINLPKKKYHLLKKLKNRSPPKRIIPSLRSINTQLLIIRRDGKKIIKDLKGALYLISRLVFNKKFNRIKE